MHFVYTITLLLLVQNSLQQEFKSKNQDKMHDEKAPYEVGLRIKWRNSTILCGGSLIKPAFVLTAASCFPEDRGQIESLRIYIGTKSLLHKDPGTVIVKAKKILKYNEFDSKLKFNDIAVVKLRKPVVLSDKIALVKLSTISDANLLEGKIGTVCCSDIFDETNKSEKHLTKIKVRIGTLYRAKNINITDPSQILSVSGPKFGNRFFGLWGSPLMLGNTNTQIAVTSIKDSQIYIGNSGNIFTNVGPYSNWVNKVIN